MKLSIALSSTFILCTQANRLIVEFQGDCNFEKVLEEAGDDLYNFFSSEADAEAEVEALCQNARDKNSDPKKGAYNFKKITGKGWQFDNNYFDGGTYLNEEYEPQEVNFDDVYDNIAQDTLITYPDTSDTVEKNFADCATQSVMCCWVQDRYDDGNDNGNCAQDDCKDADPADNTDICYVDMEDGAQSSHVAGGGAIFTLDGEDEGDAHCHGFAWDKDEQSADYRYRGNLLFYVSMYDHLSERGYVREVPGAPMCACVEQMPVVEESDCTEAIITETYRFVFRRNGNHAHTISDVAIEYKPCTNNELADRFQELADAGKTTDDAEEIFAEHIVGEGNCDQAFDTWFEDKYGFTRSTN